MVTKSTYNIFNLHTPSKGSPCGTGYEEYQEKVIDDKTGEVKIKTKKVWIYGLIQEARKTCDMDYIISQIRKGNMSVLKESNGVFMDSTDIPETIEEAQALKDEAIELYNSNPELKELYKTPGAYEKALFGGEDIASKILANRIKKVQAKVNPQPGKEVLKEESKPKEEPKPQGDK